MKLKRLLTCSVLLCLPTLAQADIRFNGFASIVAGKSLDSDSSLYGYDDSIDFKNETKFALQMSADLGERLSATAQIMARGDKDFNAEFEWAYLTYEINDNSQISAGKMRIPFYRYSDFLDVGYAYRWIRPPQAVYSLNFSTYEGLNYLYNSTLGDWDSTIQVVYGSFNGETNAITDGDASTLQDTVGVNWTMTYDWLSLRAAYLFSDVSIDPSGSADLSGLLAGLQGYGFNAARDGLDFEEDKGTFKAVGISIDYNDVLLDAEYIELEVDKSLLAPQERYYLSLGYRINEWMVHATYESQNDEHDASSFNLAPATFTHPQLGVIPASTDPTNPDAPLLRDLVNGTLASQKVDRETLSFGARYDFHPSAAFKIDYSTRDDNLSNTDVSVLSFGIDLVF